MELGPEDVSLLERCPHFRGCYVKCVYGDGPEDCVLNPFTQSLGPQGTAPMIWARGTLVASHYDSYTVLHNQELPHLMNTHTHTHTHTW